MCYMPQMNPLAVRMTPELRDAVDAAAQARGMSRNAWIVAAMERALRAGSPDPLERIADNELEAAREASEARQRIEGPPPLNRIPTTVEEVERQLQARGIHVTPEGAEPVVEDQLVDAVTGEVVPEGSLVCVLHCASGMWTWAFKNGRSGAAANRRQAESDARRAAYPQEVSFDG